MAGMCSMNFFQRQKAFSPFCFPFRLALGSNKHYSAGISLYKQMGCPKTVMFHTSAVHCVKWHPLLSASKDQNIKHPIRLSEGLLFELHGHAAGNPCREEEDMHIMLRCWQFGNMLITVQHVLAIQPIEPVPLILGMADIQIIRVKWYLHAREKVIRDLLGYLRGDFSRRMLESVRKSTREMLEDQEAVRGRLFILQDVMQSTARALVQEKSLRVTHNLTILGSCAVILSIITGLYLAST